MNAATPIETLLSGRELGWSEAQDLMRAMMSGDAEDAWIAGVLVALRAKGATGGELAAFADVLRHHALQLSSQHPDLVDTCGTGGGRATFNLSTASAFVAAAAGAKVAKHGNRAVTSKCGSADVLEALGVPLLADPEQLSHQLDSLGLVFMFAPHHHPAMRHVASARKALGIRTVFNQLGPLGNPAGARRQLIGVYSADLLMPMGQALLQLGCEHALIVHGDDGMDEISPCASTRFVELRDGSVSEGRFEPMQFGQAPLDIDDLAPGDTLEENAGLLRQALTEPDSPQGRAVIPNSAAALYLAGLGPLAECATLARDAIADGRAIRKLAEMIEVSGSL